MFLHTVRLNLNWNHHIPSQVPTPIIVPSPVIVTSLSNDQHFYCCIGPSNYNETLYNNHKTEKKSNNQTINMENGTVTFLHLALERHPLVLNANLVRFRYYVLNSQKYHRNIPFSHIKCEHPASDHIETQRHRDKINSAWSLNGTSTHIGFRSMFSFFMCVQKCCKTNDNAIQKCIGLWTGQCDCMYTGG